MLSEGFIDSCCAPVNYTVVGRLERDIKNPAGQVVIPEGSTFVIVLAAQKKVDSRLEMTFALASAEFGGRHYRISSADGQPETGALATFTGAKAGTAEAIQRGVNIHIEDHSLMNFEAVHPITFKAVQ
jgi:hypothetical protein